jgi:hypothetical protein
VYCPKCGLQGSPGSVECPDCQVPLLSGAGLPDPDLELVVVLESNEPLAFTLAKASLEEAGIPFLALNEIAQLVTDIDPMLHKWVQLKVPRDREAEAREVLAPILNPLTVGEES